VIPNIAWFFIKIGTGSLPDGTHDHWLYNNLTELGYAAVDLSIISSAQIMNVTKISHTGQGPGAPVPEPATMLLLGSGLIGLGVFGRKKFFKKS